MDATVYLAKETSSNPWQAALGYLLTTARWIDDQTWFGTFQVGSLCWQSFLWTWLIHPMVSIQICIFNEKGFEFIQENRRSQRMKQISTWQPWVLTHLPRTVSCRSQRKNLCFPVGTGIVLGLIDQLRTGRLFFRFLNKQMRGYIVGHNSNLLLWEAIYKKTYARYPS